MPWLSESGFRIQDSGFRIQASREPRIEIDALPVLDVAGRR